MQHPVNAACSHQVWDKRPGCCGLQIMSLIWVQHRPLSAVMREVLQKWSNIKVTVRGVPGVLHVDPKNRLLIIYSAWGRLIILPVFFISPSWNRNISIAHLWMKYYSVKSPRDVFASLSSLPPIIKCYSWVFMRFFNPWWTFSKHQNIMRFLANICFTWWCAKLMLLIWELTKTSHLIKVMLEKITTEKAKKISTSARQHRHHVLHRARLRWLTESW